MYGYIYRTSFSNGEFYYVGQKTSSVFLGEKYIGSGAKIKEYKEKYPDNIKVELIEEVYGNHTELDNRERFWIEKYDAVKSDNYLNLSSGGQSGGFTGNHSEESKRKMSEAKNRRKK